MWLAKATYGLLQKTEDPHSLQELVEVGVKCGRGLCGINIGVQLLSVGFR